MIEARRSVALLAGTVFFLGAGKAAETLTLPTTKAAMEDCLRAALAKQAGDIVKLEFKTERKVPIYEFEIAGKDGKTFELECDANRGEITEQEQEVASPEDPLFKAKAKLSEQEARAIAQKGHPGEIVETEYEIEANGDPSYEFDIKTPAGKEVKLEVDAASGKIVEDEEDELYQIGRE